MDSRKTFVLLLITSALILTLSGCGSKGGMGGVLTSSDVLIVQHHMRQHYKCLEEFCRRLYLKNPKYERDIKERGRKLRNIFKGRALPETTYDKLPSHEILTAAFSAAPSYHDRVALLGLGLRKVLMRDMDRMALKITICLPVCRSL